MPLLFVVGVLIFILLVVLLVHYWRRMIDGSLTVHFRAAESISEGHLPPAWATQIERQLWWRRWHPLFWVRRQQTSTALALDKLENLGQFFARSTFLPMTKPDRSCWLNSRRRANVGPS